MFTFTENDLPPGRLTERLLAAGVCVVLTHAHPEAASPLRRRTRIDSDGVGAHDAGGDDHAANNAASLMESVAHSATPDTDPDASDDAREDETGAKNSGARSASNAGTSSSSRGRVSDEERDGQFYLSSDKESIATSPGAIESLQVTVVDSVLSSGAAPWNTKPSGSHVAHNSGYTTPSRSGYTTPLSGTCPSPIRSCPRAAVSSRKEGLNERSKPGGAPRWASSKMWTAPVMAHSLPHTPSGSAAERADKRSRAGDPLGRVGPNSARLPAHRANDGEGGHGAGDYGGVYDLSSNGSVRDGSMSAPWALASPGSAQASGPAIRLDKLALLAESHGGGWGQTNNGGSGASRHDRGAEQGRLKESNLAARTTSMKRLPPSVQEMLETASKRSFDDLQSSKHTSVFGSEADKSEEGGGGGSSSDGDGEKATLAACVLAGWVDSGMGPPQDDSRPVSGHVGRRLVATEDLMSMPPLKQRGWPPPQRVVAGEMEIQNVLKPRGDTPSSQGRHRRKHGSTGRSWGEDAKLALATKRLQWEK